MAKVTAIPATKTLPAHSAATPLSARRRVAAYARVSTDLEEQQSSYHAHIDYYTGDITSRADWEFAGMYSDEGISGTSAKHREGFQNIELFYEHRRQYPEPEYSPHAWTTLVDHATVHTDGRITITFKDAAIALP